MTGQRRILIVSYTGQGHINPSLQFAKRLIKMGATVTFCTCLSVVRRIDTQTTPHALTFVPFSDGHDTGKQPITTLQQFISDFATNGALAVAGIITSGIAAGRPFDHLLYTNVIPWAARVANNYNVKSTLLWCQPAIVLDLYYYYHNGYQDLIASNNHNPSFPINFPGLPPLTIADLPSFFLPANPVEHEVFLPIIYEHVEVLKTNPRIVVNSFEELEIGALKAIDKLEMLPVGPLLPSAFLDGKDPSDNSFGGDLFDKPEADYIRWLNTKPKGSVIYVSFGSLSTFSTDQAEEMAFGLLVSRRPFLWVMRDGGEAGKLSKIEALEKQGMIVSWCSQVEVLNHEAIGCFLTHCGWNSTLEAIVAGVPTVTFPQWTDQGVNSKMVEEVWKTGVKARRRGGNGVVEGKEIERCLEMVMGDGEKGKEVRRNAEKWRFLAREAVNNGGSSAMNLQAFLDDV